MGQIRIDVSPPEYWQAFQEFAADVCRFEWADITWMNLFGREGQSQDGVDIFVQRESGDVIGIECKKRRQVDSDGKMRAGGDLSTKDIDDFIAKAAGFQPTLSRFVVATTSYPDGPLQAHVLALNKARKNKPFPVELWFWDRFQTHVNTQPTLMYKHYELVLKSRQDYDPELHLLVVLQTAFTRPAFETSLFREDSGVDFREAMLDTQNALTTGTLVDREFKERVIDRAPVGLPGVTKHTDWLPGLGKVRDTLGKIREAYREGIINHRIEEWHGGIRGDPRMAEEIDRLRAKAIEELNEVLTLAKLIPVTSRLLKSGQSRTKSAGRRK